MFIKDDDDPQNHRRHRDLFLRSRPYRGEPPTEAGFLLYPDTPTKMETTSREAFCFRRVSQHDRGKGDRIAPNTQQEVPRSHPTSWRPTGRGTRDCDPREDDQTDATEMQSQYQKDFPPPSSSSCCRRRTPALPQPDNLGINPGFRIDFSTVQRETFPGWSVTNTPRATASGQSHRNK